MKVTLKKLAKLERELKKGGIGRVVNANRFEVPRSASLQRDVIEEMRQKVVTEFESRLELEREKINAVYDIRAIKAKLNHEHGVSELMTKRNRLLDLMEAFMVGNITDQRLDNMKESLSEADFASVTVQTDYDSTVYLESLFKQEYAKVQAEYKQYRSELQKVEDELERLNSSVTTELPANIVEVLEKVGII